MEKVESTQEQFDDVNRVEKKKKRKVYCTHVYTGYDQGKNQ